MTWVIFQLFILSLHCSTKYDAHMCSEVGILILSTVVVQPDFFPQPELFHSPVHNVIYHLSTMMKMLSLI